jgi:CRP/FNR family transcriptional regulator, cyclic AMP receptor protein
MPDLRQRYRDLPVRELAAGEVLIEEGVRADRLYVLESGSFEVVKDGVKLARIREPELLIGEISVVLGSDTTATVVAAEPSRVRVMENATASIMSQPELVFAIAQTLARRLAGLTAYVASVRRQYADSETHLAMLDRVVGELLSVGPEGKKVDPPFKDIPEL